jgi:putative aminophosphonate oxidoreductase
LTAAPPHRSLWLQEVAGDSPDAAALLGSVRADVAIIAGGFVGLWTALRIKELAPAADVVILEQDICGGGASGRNGGLVLSWMSKLSSLEKLFGIQEALRVAQASEAAIHEIGEFCRQYCIDADFRKGGWLWTATTSAQLAAWEGVVRHCERNGVHAFERLEPAEVSRRAGSPAHRAGVFISNAAVVQPAALARGLRRVAVAQGVRIFENTRVLRFTRSAPVRIETPAGSLVSEKLVLATNAWSASIRELSRSITVISSDIIATAPAPAVLRQIGWSRDVAISDSQTMVDYYRISRSGRVIFGKGGWTIAYSGNIGRNFDRHPRRAAEVLADFRRYYPQLSAVPITHDWSGPIDRTPDSLPRLGVFSGHANISYGIGWSGNGVGPSVIGGRILASLALDRKDDWSAHSLVGRSLKNFPPEPIRYAGAHVLRAAVAAKERAEMQERTPSKLAVALAKLAPAGLEDKS